MIPTKIPELNVNKCYYTIIEQCPQVLDYLPDPFGKKQQLPDNEFFWKILYSLCKDSVLNFVEQVYEQRRQKNDHLNKVKKLAIDEEFVNELLKYDFQSSKKGKRPGTLLLEKNPNGGARDLMRQRTQA